MSRWQTAHVRTHCGFCDQAIPAGAPYLARGHGAHRPLLRCRACAGEPVPTVLPTASPRPRLQLPDWTPIAAVVPSWPPLRHAPPAVQAAITARLDAIRTAAGRDPGEEG